MCDVITISMTGQELQTVREFGEHYKADLKKYSSIPGVNDEAENWRLDYCLCHVDLIKFFKDHPQYKAVYDLGKWYVES